MSGSIHPIRSRLMAAAEQSPVILSFRPERCLRAWTVIALSVFAAGCAAPFRLVHDGREHPAECRSGKQRVAGLVPDIRDHVIAIDGQGRPHDPSSPTG